MKADLILRILSRTPQAGSGRVFRTLRGQHGKERGGQGNTDAEDGIMTAQVASGREKLLQPEEEGTAFFGNHRADLRRDRERRRIQSEPRVHESDDRVPEPFREFRLEGQGGSGTDDQHEPVIQRDERRGTHGNHRKITANARCHRWQHWKGNCATR